MSVCIKFNTMSQLKKKRERWFLYILKCSDSTFYTGVTCDILRRLKQHNDGIASRYTRGRLPVEIFFQEPCKNKSAALKKEYEIKSMTRKQKELYVRSNCRCARYLRNKEIPLKVSIPCTMLGLWCILRVLVLSSICGLMYS